MQSVSPASARRLALARGALLSSPWSGVSSSARGDELSQRAAAHAVIARFGYLQLDTISVAGARSHALVLLSRLEGFDPSLGERLLVPGAPLCEFWGHAASWLPLDLWPVMEFRRERFRSHPRWGRVLIDRRSEADALLRRARNHGPFRSSELDGTAGEGWWRAKESKRVAEALWSAGELAIRERRGFQRVYDLTERVIPNEVLRRSVSSLDAHRALILLALDGHGWAETRTLAATWNLRPTHAQFTEALRSLVDEGSVVPCALRTADGSLPGWIRPSDLELASRLARWRPRADRGILLSPFDPILWDRARVRLFFGFDQVFEAYVPPSKRRFGYFALPVLAGERLVARVDLKADRASRALRVLATHFEARRPTVVDRMAVRSAIDRHAAALQLAVFGGV